MILPAIALAAWLTYVVVLRVRTRHHKAAAATGDTVFVVQMTQRVRDQL